MNCPKCTFENKPENKSCYRCGTNLNSEDFPDVEAERWIKPRMLGYQMMCCDCGLIHEIDFQVVRVVEVLADGSKLLEEAGDAYEVELRARRIER